MAPSFLACLYAVVFHVNALYIPSTTKESCYYCTNGKHWRSGEEETETGCSYVELKVCSKSAMVEAMKQRFHKYCGIEPVGAEWSTEYKQNDTDTEGQFAAVKHVWNRVLHRKTKSRLMNEFGAGREWASHFAPPSDRGELLTQIQQSLEQFTELPVVKTFIQTYILEKTGPKKKDRLCEKPWRVQACNFKFCEGNDQSAADSGKTFEEPEETVKSLKETVKSLNEDKDSLQEKVESLQRELWNEKANVDMLNDAKSEWERIPNVSASRALRENVDTLTDSLQKCKIQVKHLKDKLEDCDNRCSREATLKSELSTLNHELKLATAKERDCMALQKDNYYLQNRVEILNEKVATSKNVLQNCEDKRRECGDEVENLEEKLRNCGDEDVETMECDCEESARALLTCGKVCNCEADSYYEAALHWQTQWDKMEVQFDKAQALSKKTLANNKRLTTENNDLKEVNKGLNEQIDNLEKAVQRRDAELQRKTPATNKPTYDRQLGPDGLPWEDSY